MAEIEEIIERDGGDCVWCGRELWPEDYSLEHLCPRSKGGTRELENSLLACLSCNRRRRSKAAVSFARNCSEQGLAPRWELLEAALRRLSLSGRRQHRRYGAKQLHHL